jgi:hypothetical protein
MKEIQIYIPERYVITIFHILSFFKSVWYNVTVGAHISLVFRLQNVYPGFELLSFVFIISSKQMT